MDWKELKKRVDLTENDDIGDVIVEAIYEGGDSAAEIGKYVDLVFDDCKTEAEFKIANAMLVAITGWGIETLLNRMGKETAE